MADVLEAKLAFIRKILGPYQMAQGSKNVAVSCPKCKNSQKKKFAIRLDDDRTHCWVCGLGGRLVSVLVQFKPSSVHEYITKFVGQNVNLLQADDVPKIAEMPSGFQLLATAQDSNDLDVKWALNYLLKRKMSERDLWYFKFGISREPSMRRRVIMPSFDSEGVLNFFTGRAIDDDAFRKYMNCDVEKKTIVFNEINLDWKKELTLVEGPFDLTKCDDNATCLLGSSLSEDSILFSKIYKNMTPIVLALDCDMVNKTWQRLARMLSSYDIPVKIIDLGKFKDVGEMTKKQFLEAKSQAKIWDRMDALQMKIASVKV